MSGEQITEVREAHKFDETKLAEYLAERIDGFSTDMEVQQFEGGQSNPTFLIKSNNKRYVVRKKPPGTLLSSAHAVDREYKIMTALKDSPVPVPNCLLLCEDDEVIGTPFFVMDYVEGRLLKEIELPDMSIEERAEIYDEMNRVLALLHQVNPDDYGLSDFGKPGNYYERQIGRWTKQYLAAKTDEVECMENLMRWLPENIPLDQERRIVHGDYLLNNMMFHPSKPEVIALFDWELSTLGDPIADLAYNCMPYHLNPLGGDILANLTHTGIPSEADYVKKYCERTGRDSIKNWNFYLSFSYFRYASIIQGVHKRSIQGNASSDQASGLGQYVQMVGDVAWNLVKDQ